MDKHCGANYTKETIKYLLTKNTEHSTIQKDYLALTQCGKISLNQRENLIAWISEICESQSASKKSVQLSIYYLESFLSKKPISSFSVLELVGLVCISIALKYEESRDFSPHKISSLCQKRFSLQAVISTEVYVLSILNWKIDYLTPLEALHYLFEFTCGSFEAGNIAKATEGYIEAGMRDYEISRHSPIVVAVASAICVLQIANYEDFCKDWLRLLETEMMICVSTCLAVSGMIRDKIRTLSSC